MWKKLLAYSFSKVYNTPEKLEELRNAINAETWFGAQAETGGHALGGLKPLGDYEMISIKCVLTGNTTMFCGAVKTTILSYWEHEWFS